MNMELMDHLTTPIAPIALSDKHRAPARLLEYAPGHAVVLTPAATVGLVPIERVMPVPGAPQHALGLLPSAWGYLPLLDLAPLLGSRTASRPAALALVVAWQARTGAPLEYGALCAPELVQLSYIGDDQRCDWPPEFPAWPAYGDCCVSVSGNPMPLLDLARVFGPRAATIHT
jgi:hypothetical protein